MSSSEDAHTCPICLEPIFAAPVDEDGNPVGSNKYNIGATVPCGHLYHYDCFGSWQASRSYGTVKCPTCNVKTDNFVRLYLDVGSLGGPQCHLADVDEDDISLSSSIDEEGEDDENDDCNEEPAAAAAAAAASSDPNDENENDVVDLTDSPQRSVSRPLQQATNNSRNNGNNNENDPQRQTKIRRLSRIAKKFKRQYLQKSAQYKEQYSEKRKLSDKIRNAETELKSTQEQMSELQGEKHTLQLTVNESKLDLARLRQERDSLKAKCSAFTKDKSLAENKLRECHSYYQKELENARTKSMSEVQEIMEEHPKVVKENKGLKQKLFKLQQQTQELERMYKSLARRNGNNNSISNSIEANRKASSKDIQKALRQMDAAVSTQKATPYKSTAPRNPFETADSLLAKPTNGSKASSNNHSSSSNRRLVLKKVNTGQYSSLASRMMKASEKAKKPPQGSKKRPSIAALSLSSSQNKRTKSSTSASRWDLFQRKP